MALTNQISFSLIDDRSNRATVVIFVPTGLTDAQYQTYADSMAAALDTLTAAQILQISMSKALTVPGGLKANAVADVFNEQGANFAYQAANTNYRHTVRVPALKGDYITDGAVLVGDADVIAFEALITAGNGVVLPTDRDGNDLTAKLGAVLTFRK